jgi:hypothetical protein
VGAAAKIFAFDEVSQTEEKDQTKNHRTKTPPASAGNRSLNLQTR